MIGRPAKDQETGLAPNEEAFCQARVMHNAAEAYRISQAKDIIRKLTNEQIKNRAAKMGSKPAVIARLRVLVDTKKIGELDTIGRYFIDLMRFIEQAEEKKNFTALASLMRLRGQAIGALRENVTVNWEGTVSDSELVKRVAGQNPLLGKALAKSLGVEDAFAA